MSFNKIHNKFVVTCDDCGEFLDTGTADFREATDKYKEEQWQFARIEGVAMHFCPDCGDDPTEGLE